MKQKKLSKEQKITADVDDELYLLKKRVQLKHGLTWARARDGVNKAVRLLYSM